MAIEFLLVYKVSFWTAGSYSRSKQSVCRRRHLLAFSFACKYLPVRFLPRASICHLPRIHLHSSLTPDGQLMCSPPPPPQSPQHAAVLPAGLDPMWGLFWVALFVAVCLLTAAHATVLPPNGQVTSPHRPNADVEHLTASSIRCLRRREAIARPLPSAT